jgi:hypothetical protein
MLWLTDLRDGKAQQCFCVILRAATNAYQARRINERRGKCCTAFEMPVVIEPRLHARSQLMTNTVTLTEPASQRVGGVSRVSDRLV